MSKEEVIEIPSRSEWENSVKADRCVQLRRAILFYKNKGEEPPIEYINEARDLGLSIVGDRYKTLNKIVEDLEESDYRSIKRGKLEMSVAFDQLKKIAKKEMACLSYLNYLKSITPNDTDFGARVRDYLKNLSLRNNYD